MARENKLMKTLAARNTQVKDMGKNLDSYLEQVGEEPFENTEKSKGRAKATSVALYPEDMKKIQVLKRRIEDETGELSASVSGLFRALLHNAVIDRKFIQMYRKLK